ncbi:MAG: HAD-IA family hydrolase [Parvularculaceae bacterium]|nr:HAD-IA family hydrolase [Parvularculaceae bacterium]
MPELSGVAVIFDLDGTLVDTAADLAAAMNHVLVENGLAPTPLDRVRHLVGHGARAMLKQGFAQAGRSPAEVELDGHVDLFLDYYMAHIADESRPFPGALQAIVQLKADGASVAICTNKREIWARALMRELNLETEFAAIVGADTVGVAKPDAAPVLHCLALTGAARGVFVGDSDTDIRAAAAASMPCLAARFGYGPLTLADQAEACFSNYAEAGPLIRQAARKFA